MNGNETQDLETTPVGRLLAILLCVVVVPMAAMVGIAMRHMGSGEMTVVTQALLHLLGS